MERRIIKETLQNGNIQYRVETQSLLGKRWVTDTFYDAEHDTIFEAVFSTKEEAEIHAYDEPEGMQIVKREIV